MGHARGGGGKRKRVAASLVLLLALLGAVAVRLTTAVAPTASRSIAVGAWPRAVAVDPATGHAFVADRGDGTVAVVDLATARLLGKAAIGVEPWAAAIDQRTGRAFVTALAGQSVSTFDTASGQLLRTITVGQTTGQCLVAINERVGRAAVLNCRDPSVTILDAASGRALRTRGTPVVAGVQGLLGAVAVDDRTGHVFVESRDAGARAISTLDARTGATLAVARVGAYPVIAADGGTGRVIVADERDTRVRVLDARSGRVWRTLTVPYPAVALAVDERRARVFIATWSRLGPVGSNVTGNGHVLMLDGRTGALLRVTAVGDTPTAIAVDQGSDHVLVTTSIADPTDPMGHVVGYGSVHVLDATTGMALWTVPVGVAPVALAIDERTHQAVVTNAGVNTDGTPVMVRTLPAPGWLTWLHSRLPFVPLPRAASTAGSITILDSAR